MDKGFVTPATVRVLLSNSRINNIISTRIVGVKLVRNYDTSRKYLYL